MKANDVKLVTGLYSVAKNVGNGTYEIRDAQENVVETVPAAEYDVERDVTIIKRDN